MIWRVFLAGGAFRRPKQCDLPDFGGFFWQVVPFRSQNSMTCHELASFSGRWSLFEPKTPRPARFSRLFLAGEAFSGQKQQNFDLRKGQLICKQKSGRRRRASAAAAG